MEKLFNQITSALKKYSLSQEDKEDIAQNCMIYCFRSNSRDLPMSHVRQIVKTQTRLLFRPTYRKINLLMPDDMDYSSVVDANAMERMEDRVYLWEIKDVIMSIKTIPIIYREAISSYILEEYTFKEIGEKLQLNPDTIRYYMRSNINKIEALLDNDILTRVRLEV